MTSTTGGQKRAKLAAQVEQAVATVPITDIHTHLYDPAFGSLLLWGIDDLLVYHYLIAEVFRYLTIPSEKFWQLSKAGQAELIWKELFIEHSPISEACRGVLTTLRQLGLDVKARDLPALRRWFAGRSVDDFISRCMKLGGVQKIYMTNSPFDDEERPVWEKGFSRDERFVAGLRLDPLILNWRETAPRLKRWGYAVQPTLTPATISAVRRFLSDWTKRMNPRYVMASFPAEFMFPAKTDPAQIIERAILPHCREFGLPLALMMGVKRGVNPALRAAGDGSGLAQMEALANLCSAFPENKFLTTVLARENQHELCVLARKFPNLHIFGCWWFTNVPSVVEEMTRMRLELVGLSVTLQHSDARVLDQLVYKWQHFRKVAAKVLIEKYSDLLETGWEATPHEIERDVQDLFGGAFERFCGH